VAEQLPLPAEYRFVAVAPVHRITARASVAVLRAQGHGLSETARRLNAAAVPTPSGLIGRWLPSTVQRVEYPDRANAYMREWRRRNR
jgi:hypothetical protein